MRSVHVAPVLAALVAALLVAPGTPGVAGERPGSTASMEGRLVLVLDSSGSMAQRAPGGGTKIEAARAALTDVVDTLPDDAEVGMRVFGATVFSRGDRGACTDTQNVVPVGPLDRGSLTSEIADYEPYGETPIGNALRGAGKDLGRSGKRTIVLLSDGEPTCAPDPCRVARELRRGGIDLTINVVGLDVSGPARRALECVARTGGGTYYDVSDPDELAGSLVSVSVRSLRRFSVEGDPVEGGATEADAPTIVPGQHIDRIPRGETTRYYRVEKEPDAGLQVGVTTRPAGSGELVERLELRVRTPEGDDCDDSYDRRVNVLQERSIVSTGIHLVPGVSGGVDEACFESDSLLVEVEYGDDTITKDLELVVAEQPPLAEVESLPAGVEDTDEYVEPADVRGKREPVLGGAGFGDAPVLGPGVFSDTLRPGEQLLYKVPVGWGQSARVRIIPEAEPLADEVLGLQGNPVAVRAFTPYRQSLGSLSYPDDEVDDSGFYDGVDVEPLTFVLAPVRLRNAELNDSTVDAVSLAGNYWFSVEMGRLDDDTRFAAPLRIEVELVGDVEGEPTSAESAASASPSASASGAPGTQQGAAAPEKTSSAAAEEDDGVGAAWWGGLGILLLAVVTGGVLAVRRRGMAG